MRGQVDAVFGAFRNFELNQINIEGVEGKCFYIEEEGVPPYDELIFVVKNDNINKETLIKFLSAIEKATQFIINHPDESWKIFSSRSRELDNELNYRAWYDTIPRFALRPASLDSGRYIRFEKFMYESGLISSIYEHERMAIEIFE